MRFILRGHDLSYWDDAANGWVVPDGQFQVYLGDSSALANLPLQASFAVVRTVGARYATLNAPATIDAGDTATVTARLVNDGDYGMPRAEFRLRAPAGWTVSRPGPGHHRAAQYGHGELPSHVPRNARAGDPAPSRSR